MFTTGNRWFAIKDGDPRAFALMRNHYSYQPYTDGRRQDPTNPNRFLFVGPGQKTVLMTVDCLALFVWRKFIDKSGQRGVNCAVFHNSGPSLSSELILEAEQLAWKRWPRQRLYTYVNARKIKSDNPGYCFKCAGWQFVGYTASKKLHILEKLPLRSPNKHLQGTPIAASAGKRVEMPKYDKCPKCNKSAVHLAMATIHRFYGDSDDQNGDESIFGDEEVTPEYEVSLFAHVCFECGYLKDVGIESPRDKEVNTSTH